MDFNILHLSDLHISSKIDTLQKLLKDIKEQTKDLHDIVVVVTGDIVNRGVYDASARTNVLNFFDELYTILGLKFKSLFMVPGNHDKSQSTSGNILTTNFSKNDNPISLEKIDWNYQLLAYENYLNLEDDIFKHLFPTDPNKHLIHHANIYGVEVYQNYESAIIFIKIDTSWCSLGGNKDKRNLRISKSQLEELTQEYKNKCKEYVNKKIFTIALCHHPLNWLTENDESLLYSYLTNSDYLNVDVLLCGHTHDVDIQNLFSNTHQITTFVTGIGWNEETPMEKRSGHRYSLYIFNLRRNSCEVIVRKTDLRGNFDIDREFFPDKESKDKGRLSLPILPKNSHPFIKIPVCLEKELLYTPLFIDNKILLNIKEYHSKILSLRIHMTEFLSQITRNSIVDFDTLNNIDENKKQDTLRDYFYNNNSNGIINNLLEYNSKYIHDLFTSFLYELCNWFVQLFKEYFDDNENFRILFRIYVNSDHEYKQICCQSKYNIEHQFNAENSYEQDNLARNIKFDGLIKKSFDFDSALVYSSNSWFNSFTPKRWENYICIIPNYENMQLDKIGKLKDKRVPFILCTISTHSDRKSIFLDILNYVEIKTCISDIISSFVNIYKINFDKYRKDLIVQKLITKEVIN